MALLPETLRAAIYKTLGQIGNEGIEEIRLRVGKEMLVRCGGREYASGVIIKQALLKEILAKSSDYSLYSHEETLRSGWLPLPDGARIGIAARISGDGLRDVSSLVIRLPYSGEVWCEKDFLTAYHEGFRNTLILSPPGWGKTTLLRDLIRRFSLSGKAIGVADDRYELAAVCKGVPSFDLGPRTDVVSGGNKARAAMMLLRSLSPDVIAFDEITAEEDMEAAENAAFLGVGLLATAHAGEVSDLQNRKLYRNLLESHVFSLAIVIRMEEGKRKYRVEKL